MKPKMISSEQQLQIRSCLFLQFYYQQFQTKGRANLPTTTLVRGRKSNLWCEGGDKFNVYCLLILYLFWESRFALLFVKDILSRLDNKTSTSTAGWIYFWPIKISPNNWLFKGKVCAQSVAALQGACSDHHSLMHKLLFSIKRLAHSSPLWFF